jgi:hypothetical protein
MPPRAFARASPVHHLVSPPRALPQSAVLSLLLSSAQSLCLSTARAPPGVVALSTAWAPPRASARAPPIHHPVLLPRAPPTSSTLGRSYVQVCRSRARAALLLRHWPWRGWRRSWRRSWSQRRKTSVWGSDAAATLASSRRGRRRCADGGGSCRPMAESRLDWHASNWVYSTSPTNSSLIEWTCIGQDTATQKFVWNSCTKNREKKAYNMVYVCLMQRWHSYVHLTFVASCLAL